MAELHEFLKPLATPIRVHREVLHRLCDARQAAQDERASLTKEQREEIVSDFQRKMEALRRELPTQREIGRVLAQPRPLTHEQLVTVYRDQLRQAEASDNVLAKNIALTRLRSLDPQEAA